LLGIGEPRRKQAQRLLGFGEVTAR
jgi:hypothetical protein